MATAFDDKQTVSEEFVGQRFFPFSSFPKVVVSGFSVLCHKMWCPTICGIYPNEGATHFFGHQSIDFHI